MAQAMAYVLFVGPRRRGPTLCSPVPLLGFFGASSERLLGLQAQDLGEFLETEANRTGARRGLFWFMFATMTWTLWTIRNKMVIERVFLRRASDVIFKFLAFVQQWHPLCRQRDREQLDDMVHALLIAARLHSSPPNR